MELKFKESCFSQNQKIGKIFVKAGDSIKKGDRLLNVEGGKIVEPIMAPNDMLITDILVKTGDVAKSGMTYIIAEDKDAVSPVNSKIKATFSDKDKAYKVGSIKVQIGEDIKKGDILFMVEDGKLVQPVKSPCDFVVDNILIKSGDTVKDGDAVASAKANNLEKPIIESKSTAKHTIDCDLAILGAGPGGYEAALYAAKRGLKTTLIEKGYLGGTCLNVGCIPTKSIIYSTELYKKSKSSEAFGITNQKTEYDLKKIISHKDMVVDKLRCGIASMLETAGVDLIRGKGTFVDSKTIEVIGDDGIFEVKFKDAIIATGSSVAKLPIDGLGLDCVMDSDKILSNTEEFASLTIIGGGVIGMEFASIFSNLGKSISVVEFMPRILSMVDNDVSDAMLSDLKADIYTNSKVTKISKSLNGKAIVYFKKGEEEHSILSDKVLIAVGRKANIADIGLEKAGVGLTERKNAIQVNDMLQTNIEHIYAIGDVNAKLSLAHSATHQGYVAVDNILGIKRTMDYINVPSVIFTGLEIATVGLNENDIKKANKECKITKFYYSGNGKAVSMGATQGFIKLISDIETGKIVGAAAVGEDASNLIATLTMQIRNGITADEAAHTVFAHPTLSEVIAGAYLRLADDSYVK